MIDEPERKCPECGSTHYKMQKRPNGYTSCLDCKRIRLHAEFWTILTQEEAESMSLDELCHPAETIYADDYGKTIVNRYDYIEANGGDGTLLKAIAKFRNKRKPFFGVGTGTLNFLMNKDSKISEEATYTKFNLIKVKVTGNVDENAIDYDGPREYEFQAFNEVMFGGDMNSWIEFNVHDADKIIGKFKGGGVSICTAQGSTGFNRGNGGSVLPLSSDQWFVTSAFSKRNVRVPIEPKRTTITAESRTPVTVWVDGRNNVIEDVQKIEISQGDEVTVIFNDYDEFKRKRRV